MIPVRANGAVSQKASLGGFFSSLPHTDLEIETMLPNKSPQGGPCRSALALFALLVHAPVFGEEAKPPKDESDPKLEPLIVSALRTPRAASTVTSSVSRLDPEELTDRGLYQLRDALNQSPGVISTSNAGETGAVGGLFIRGTTTNYSQIVLDGMRMSDSSNPMGNFLAGGRAYDIGNIEILRGPQGAIYGGESIGGVLWMETPYGSGDPHGSTTVEAGSFDSLSAHSMFQGRTGNLSYYLSGGYETTENDAPNQSFHQGNTALRLEGQLNPVWTLGTTFRATDSYFENSGDSDERLDSALWTVYATGKLSDRWTARFHGGFQQESYDSDSAYGNYGTDVRNLSVSTDHEITLADNLRLLAGAYLHESSYENTSGTDESRIRYGVHSALEWDPADGLTCTAALRWEDYDAYGDEFTWRVGSIYTFKSTGTTIRGGVGSSFRSPSFLDLYGSSLGPGNPDLDAESAIGWDFGVEQALGDHHTLEVTWFSNRITDRIKSSPAPPVNLSGESAANGIEAGMRGDWMDGALAYRLAWTWLHESLSEQPRNSVTASVDWKPTDKSLVGIGATHLSDHSWGGNPLGSYLVTRIYGSYQLTDRVKLHARVENVLDEEYELWSYSSPWYSQTIEGSGTGIYAGITVDW